VELGGERMLLRCGSEERRVSPGELQAAVEEMGKANPGSAVVEVRRLGIVRG
jgi:hypothetical protein